VSPNSGSWIWICPLTSRRTQPCRFSSGGDVELRRIHEHRTRPNSRQARDGGYGEGRSPTAPRRRSLLVLRPAWGLGPPDPAPASALWG
jgi:hypothetical protein